MREIRIFQAAKYYPGQKIKLTPESFKHIVNVLRMQKDQELTLFSGENSTCKARIIEITKKEAYVEVLQVKENLSVESPSSIHLAQSIAKGDRMEWIIQKAVELGVTTITPIISERTIVKLAAARREKKIKQWQDIAIGASEQCGRNKIAQILDIISYNDYIETCNYHYKFILALKAEQSFQNIAFENDKEITIITGPEGGFAKHEIKDAVDNQFTPIKLGPRVLRSETATIASISILQALAGDLR